MQFMQPQMMQNQQVQIPQVQGQYPMFPALMGARQQSGGSQNQSGDRNGGVHSENSDSSATNTQGKTMEKQVQRKAHVISHDGLTFD